jgi:SAM-dependent methyltransferase
MSEKTTNYWRYILIFIAIIFTFILLGNLSKQSRRETTEGFSQNTRYILKRNEDIYDYFYVEVFDLIYRQPSYTETIINAIEKNTQSSDASIFLDIGSKTGKIVRLLQDKGYEVYGVEPNNSMMEYTKKYQPKIKESCTRGEILDPILYERSSFSHILCLDDTLYAIKDKVAFFRNCFFWLKPGGVLVLQLLQRITPLKEKKGEGKDEGKDEEKKACKRNKKKDPFHQDYTSFTFDNSYEKNDQSTTIEIIYKETFTDKATNNIRENERLLYLDEMNVILSEAIFCRFYILGKINLKQQNKDYTSFLYFLEKTSG